MMIVIIIIAIIAAHFDGLPREGPAFGLVGWLVGLRVIVCVCVSAVVQRAWRQKIAFHCDAHQHTDAQRRGEGFFFGWRLLAPMPFAVLALGPAHGEAVFMDRRHLQAPRLCCAIRHRFSRGVRESTRATVCWMRSKQTFNANAKRCF